jgi:hypothetical protein
MSEGNDVFDMVSVTGSLVPKKRIGNPSSLAL